MTQGDKTPPSQARKRKRRSRNRPIHKHRHAARTLAMQVLFESDLSSHPLDAVMRRVIVDDNVNDTTASYLKRLIAGITTNGDEIDSLIAEAAPAYPLAQIASVDRNVLRIAVYELAYEPSVPTKAIINEAVEIAKQFGGDHSSRFVNGVTGSIAAAVRSGDDENCASRLHPASGEPPDKP